jgi:hypothetical protein
VLPNIDWRDLITIVVPMNIPQVDRSKHIATIASNFAFLQDLHCNAAHSIEISAPLSVKWGNHNREGRLFVLSPSEVAEPQMNTTCQTLIVDTPLSDCVGEEVMGKYRQNLFNGGSCIVRLLNWAIKQ